jgi:hypothetical protein
MFRCQYNTDDLQTLVVWYDVLEGKAMHDSTEKWVQSRREREFLWA